MKGVNASVAREIVARAGSVENFFEASEGALTALMGYRNRLVERAYRDEAVEKALHEADFISDNGIKAVSFSDEDYPRRLAECDDAPAMIYCLGNCDLNNSRYVSIVGTRHATSYGIELTGAIVEGLCSLLPEPPVIVSGLAFGIDIAAHRAALSSGAPTVAVLGHGLNTIYPAAHRQVAVEIARAGGMLMTEYRSDNVTHRGNFLARNRIVAGLCDCLVVVESANKGGAIVTARIAADYSREVMAVPGRVNDRYSQGCNRLITRNVAALVQGAEDVVGLMGWPKKKQDGEQAELFPELSDEEQVVVDLLTQEGDLPMAQLSATLDLPAHRMMSLLVDMEFKGLVAQVPGGRYRLG